MKKIQLTSAFGILALLTSCGPGEVDFDACGQVNATEITVSAENSGKIEKFEIREGDRLQAGQTVGFIDTTQASLKVKELKARKKSAGIKKIDIRRQTEAQYAKLENLRNEHRRYSDLLAKDAGTRKQVEDLESEIAVLEGQISASEENYVQNNSAAESEMETLDVQIAQAEDQLEKCTISSPGKGTVLAKYAEAGEMVSSGKPLFKMADLDDIYVKAYFSTSQLAGLKLGDTVDVFPDNGTDNLKAFEGKIIWISDEAEFTPKNIQTRDERADMVYAVKISVVNDGNIRLGMYAYVKLR